MSLTAYQRNSIISFTLIAAICAANKFRLFSFANPELNRFMRFYFNDTFGCAGFLLLLSTAFTFTAKRPARVTFLRIALFTLLCGLFWEYITPLYRADTVSDPFDIVAYLSGALIFWFILGGRNNPYFIKT